MKLEELNENLGELTIGDKLIYIPSGDLVEVVRIHWEDSQIGIVYTMKNPNTKKTTEVTEDGLYQYKHKNK